MLKRILERVRRASNPSPTEPTRSTFGTEATNAQSERARKDEIDRQIVIEKARSRRSGY